MAEMNTEVDSFELRDSVHELLRAREEGIKHLRAQHNATLRELYSMVARPHASGSSFPDVDLDDARSNEASMDGFEAWRASHSLELGAGGISDLVLPDLPPLSPPPSSTVFPDEQPVAGPSSMPIPLAPPLTFTNKRAISPSSPSHDGSSAPKRPRMRTPQPPTPPPESPPPMMNPNDLFALRRPFSPVMRPTVPDWVPLENYRPAATPPHTPPTIPMPLATAYTSTVPPLPPIPVVQPNRRQKKKDDIQGTTKLYAQFAVNPLSDAMRKSSKCIMTNDWRIATQELRHIRAMERIEAKKAEGRWSLRQPKKGRGVAVVKAHWDYLLEEMQWLKEDYSEERRWKRMLALEFAYQVVEWHLASPTEKAERMVGGRGWGAASDQAVPGRSGAREPSRADARGGSTAAEDDVEMLVLPETETEDGAVGEHGQAGDVLDSMMEEKETEIEKEVAKADTAADAKPTAPVAAAEGDADMDAEGEADADGEADAEGEADADGEVDDTAAGVIGLSDISTAQPSAPKEGEADADGGEEDDAPTPPSGRRDTVLANGMILNKRFSTVEELMVARKPLLGLSLTEASVDLGSLPLPTPAQPVNAETFEPSSPPSFSDLFPDLVPYDGPHPPQDGKTPKRLDEGYTSGHRIAHTSRLMDIRPVFVSTIKPAQHAFSGEWDLAVGSYYEDPRGSTMVNNEVLATSFSVFTGRGIRPPNASHVPMQTTPHAQHLRTALTWTDEEERVLLRLLTTYPYNWALIADSFNSEIVVIPTEKRTAYDCWEKWYWKWGPGKGQTRPEPPGSAKSTAVPPSAGPPSSTLTPAPASATGSVPPSAAGGPSRPIKAPVLTPGGIAVPTLPPSSAGAEANGEGPPPPGLSKREARAQKNKYEGSKKAVRHQVLFDAMRRLSRRREQNKLKANQQPQRTINVHESHATYALAQVATPMELVEMKYQRDLAAQRLRQQRMANDVARQEGLRQQQQQQAQMMAAQSAQQQQQLRAAAVVAGAAVGPGVGTPNGRIAAVAGLPNLPTASQQQLLSAVAAANSVNRQTPVNGGPAAAGSPSVRAAPTPQNQAMPLPPGQGAPGQAVGTATQTAQVQQQMEMLRAQQLAAQHAQLQAAQAHPQHARVGPRPQGMNLAENPTLPTASVSPFAAPGVELPNGNQDSPAMHHSSPQLQPGGVRPNMPMAQAAHLRVPSNGSQGSPQMASQSVPAPMPPQQHAQPQQQQQQGGGGVSSQSPLVQAIIAQIQANGQAVTAENIKAMHVQLMRQAQQTQAQNLAAQQQQQQQMGSSQGSNLGVPGGSNAAGFARSPGVQAAQAQAQAGARASPKPNP